MFVSTSSSSNDDNVVYLASLCQSCHGSDGKSHGLIPSLSGYNKQKFIDYFSIIAKTENRFNVMHKIAKGYTKDEIISMAEYFSNLKD